MVRQRKKKRIRRKIPPNRGAGERVYNAFTVVLENIYDGIETLGEGQDLLREQMESGFQELRKAIANLDRRLTALEVKVSQLAEDMSAVKHEIRLIRHDLTQKVNREEFEMLQERVVRLEKELAVR